MFLDLVILVVTSVDGNGWMVTQATNVLPGFLTNGIEELRPRWVATTSIVVDGQRSVGINDWM